MDPPVNCDRVEVTGMSSHSSTEAGIDVRLGNGVAETVYSISTSNKNEETRSWPFPHAIQAVARMAVINYVASDRQKVKVEDVWFNDASGSHVISQNPGGPGSESRRQAHALLRVRRRGHHHHLMRDALGQG